MASINDKLRKYKSLFSTTLSTGIGTGTSDTITPATVTGLPTDTAITLTIDRVDSSGIATPSKLERIKGIISGGNLIDYVRGVDGTTEQSHTAGAVVEMVWNAADLNDIVDWGLVEHSQLGVHDKTKVVDLTTAQTLTNKTLTSPKINEDVALTSTATELNALDGQTGDWTAYTPTTTNLTVGSGTIYGSYIKIGKTVIFRITFTLAADSAVGTAPTFTFPVTADNGYNFTLNAHFNDSNGGWYVGALDNNSTLVVPQAVKTDSTYASRVNITANIPFTWATGDIIAISGVYEAL